jgi:hypothetical protein
MWADVDIWPTWGMAVAGFAESFTFGFARLIVAPHDSLSRWYSHLVLDIIRKVSSWHWLLETTIFSICSTRHQLVLLVDACPSVDTTNYKAKTNHELTLIRWNRNREQMIMPCSSDPFGVVLSLFNWLDPNRLTTQQQLAELVKYVAPAKDVRIQSMHQVESGSVDQSSASPTSKPTISKADTNAIADKALNSALLSGIDLFNYKIQQVKDNAATMVELDVSNTHFLSRKIAADLLTSLARNTTLKKLIMPKVHLTSQSAGLLAEALKTNSTLEFINIQNNNIGAKGLIDLAKALESNSSLKELSIGCQNGAASLGANVEKEFVNVLQSNRT